MRKKEDLEVVEEHDELFADIITRGLFSFEDRRRRSEGNFRHSIQEVLLVWICGMICGFKTYRDIEWCGAIKIDFLRRFFPYEYGYPSKSTISRVVAIIDPKAMDDLLTATVENMRSEAASKKSLRDLPVAIDGKTNRGLKISQENTEKLHMVSAFDTDEGITLAQQVVPEKSNEIIAIKDILSYLDIEGRTITIDAIGTQKDITKLIRDRKGNYVLAVKENHPAMYHAIRDYFENQENLDRLPYYEIYGKEHGRIEKRICYATNEITIWFEDEGWAESAYPRQRRWLDGLGRLKDGNF